MNYLYKFSSRSRLDRSGNENYKVFVGTFENTWTRQHQALRFRRRKDAKRLEARKHHQQIWCEIYLTIDEGVAWCCIIYALVAFLSFLGWIFQKAGVKNFRRLRLRDVWCPGEVVEVCHRFAGFLRFENFDLAVNFNKTELLTISPQIPSSSSRSAAIHLGAISLQSFNW